MQQTCVADPSHVVGMTDEEALDAVEVQKEVRKAAYEATRVTIREEKERGKQEAHEKLPSLGSFAGSSSLSRGFESLNTPTHFCSPTGNPGAPDSHPKSEIRTTP